MGRRLNLERWPPTRDRSLRAWDAADELLLDHLSGTAPTGPDFPPSPELPDEGSVVVLNELFGALTVELGRSRPRLRIVPVVETATAAEALARNLRRNGLESSASGAVPMVRLDATLSALGTPPAAILVRIPKALGRLEYQLRLLRPYLADDTVVLGGAMTRNVHTSTLANFERIIGPTRSSWARKKARLIDARPSEAMGAASEGAIPWPVTWTAEGVEVVGHAGVFSAEGLDGGTALLLNSLDESPPPVPGPRVVDLGCGTGILGSAWARRSTEVAHVHFRDVDYLAVDSARSTFERSVRRPGVGADAVAVDLASDLGPESVELVLCNPPFHTRRARGTETAARMFGDARRILRPGGELRIVANRHLRYTPILEGLFDSVEVVTSDRRFVVLRAVR